jgi:hypothetical protein
MSRLAKFWFMTRREKKLLCEAGLLLLLSNACIKVIAFRRIDQFLTLWNNGIECRIGPEQEIGLVRCSISRAANALPWQTLCLNRSIAEFIMLRRRGIQAVLLAGVKSSGDSSLDAHAWVETGLANDKSSENSDFATVITIGMAGVDH